MSRYIDADALKEYIGSVRAEFNFFDDDERARYEAHSKAIYLLDLYVNDAPSIDIVRCRECKWRGEQTESGIPYYWCRLVGAGYEVPIEHFCSYGEREGE